MVFHLIVIVILTVITNIASSTTAPSSTTFRLLGRHERCELTPNACAPPMSCVGQAPNLRCHEKKEEGMACGQDPFWICKDDLSCVNDICVRLLGRHERCELTPNACAPPMSCVGQAPNLRCHEKKEEGMACGQDPFWVCKDDLSCVNDICVRLLGRHERCELTPNACAPPMSCVGQAPNLRCHEKKEEGMACGQDPFWVCKDDLSCVDDICVRLLGRHERCELTPNACAPPMSCVGQAPNLRCHEKKEEGMACGQDPFWVCKDNLSCVNDICVIVNGVGGECGVPNTTCEEGLSCIGTPEKKRCAQKKPIGMPCRRDPFWACEDGLTCKRNICKVRVEKGGSCGMPNSFCRRPYRCLGRPDDRKCLENKKEGEVCGMDMFSVCRRRTECIDGICTRK